MNYAIYIIMLTVHKNNNTTFREITHLMSYEFYSQMLANKVRKRAGGQKYFRLIHWVFYCIRLVYNINCKNEKLNIWKCVQTNICIDSTSLFSLLYNYIGTCEILTIRLESKITLV